MPRTTLIFLVAMMLAPKLLPAQDTLRPVQAQIDTTRIGVMSPMVIEQRLRMLGYSRVEILETTRTRASANVMKLGRPVAVQYDPHTGKVKELLGRLERRPEGIRLILPDGRVRPVPR